MAREDRNPWTEPRFPVWQCIRPQCRHRWTGRSAKPPRQCPGCHNAGWQKPPTRGAALMEESRVRGKHHCVRCGARWNPRPGMPEGHRPWRCVGCGTTNWWRPPTGHPEYLRRWKARRAAAKKAGRPT